MFASRDFAATPLRKSHVDPSLVTEQVIDDVMLGARSQGYMAGMTSLMKQYAEGREIVLAPQVHVPTLIPWGDQGPQQAARSEADALQRLILVPGWCDSATPYHDACTRKPAAEVAAAIEAWLPVTVSGRTLMTRHVATLALSLALALPLRRRDHGRSGRAARLQPDRRPEPAARVLRSRSIPRFAGRRCRCSRATPWLRARLTAPRPNILFGLRRGATGVGRAA